MSNNPQRNGGPTGSLKFPEEPKKRKMGRGCLSVIGSIAVATSIGLTLSHFFPPNYSSNIQKYNQIMEYAAMDDGIEGLSRTEEQRALDLLGVSYNSEGRVATARDGMNNNLSISINYPQRTYVPEETLNRVLMHYQTSNSQE